MFLSARPSMKIFEDSKTFNKNWKPPRAKLRARMTPRPSSPLPRSRSRSSSPSLREDYHHGFTWGTCMQGDERGLLHSVAWLEEWEATKGSLEAAIKCLAETSKLFEVEKASYQAITRPSPHEKLRGRGMPRSLYGSFPFTKA
nr:hypothetical protein Iba_chr10eCG12270 [Ipomoea batatas]